MNFDFLLELAWKSALISGAALALATALRRRTAGERSALLATAAALIVALPVITLLLPALPVVTRTVHEAAPVALTPEMLAYMASAPAAKPAGVLEDPTPLLELIWAGGAAMVLARLLAGLWTLRRWTRAGEPVTHPLWQEALERTAAEAGVRRPVRLLRADVSAPLSWGAFRPVILIDPDTAREPEEAEAVLAHEIAHVARGDWLVLILSRLAVAFFWFNPLMWLLERQIVREAEEAADARALVHVEPARYAQTLLTCAQQYTALRLPASGMADAALGQRVRAILERRLAVGAPNPRWIRMAVLAVAAIAAPIAALKPVEAVIKAPQAPAAPRAPVAPAAVPAAPSVPAAPDAPLAPSAAAGQGAGGSPDLIPPAPPAPAPLAHLAALAVPPVPPAPPAPPLPPRHVRNNMVDGEEIAREIREAIAESRVEREAAMREAMEARREALRHVDTARIAREAGAEAQRQVRTSMRSGAEGMMRGAEGMERGARQMEEEAEKLRSPEYRQRQIARAARDGRRVTDQELVDMIPQLRHGAEGMRRGAADMRRSAEKMRREG